MLKKTLLSAGLLAVLCPAILLPVGCSSTEPTIFSWPHHKRRIRSILEDLHEMHMDIDRIVFDMEPYPREVEY